MSNGDPGTNPPAPDPWQWPAPSTTPPPPPPPPPAPPPPPYGYGTPPPAGQGQYGYSPYTPPQTEGTAVVALVAAIASFMFCPFIPAVAALIIAPGAKRKIAESNGRLTGDGLVTAARWVAWINIAMCAGFALLFIALMILGASQGFEEPSEFSRAAVAVL